MCKNFGMLTLFAIAGALFCVNGATAQSTAEETRYREFKNTCCVMKQAKLTFDVRSGSKQTEILSYESSYSVHIVTFHSLPSSMKLLKEKWLCQKLSKILIGWICAKFRNRILLLHFDLYHIQFWAPTTNIRGNGFESDTYVRHKYLHQSVIPLSSSSYIFYSFSVAMFSNAIPILFRIVVVNDGPQYFHSYNLYAHCPVWYLYFLYTFGNSIEPGFCLYLTVVLVLWCIYLVNTGK